MGGTSFSDESIRNGGTIDTYFTNPAGQAVLIRCSTANTPSAKSGFAVGCLLMDTTTGILYCNTGTTSSCSFVKISGT